MSCYLRHFAGLFAEAGLEYNRQNRKAADRLIREQLQLADADCPAVWRAAKPLLNDPEQRQRLVEGLRALRP
ncbi:MAG: hypothetical protein ACUVX9_15885 [Anaerolineae bacterium]